MARSGVLPRGFCIKCIPAGFSEDHLMSCRDALAQGYCCPMAAFGSRGWFSLAGWKSIWKRLEECLDAGCRNRVASGAAEASDADPDAASL